MTHPTSGLLPALIGYYHRLTDDPEQKVADFGFSAEKIHFCLVLEPDGSLFEFQDIRDRNEKGKPIPKSMLVPDGGVRGGIGLKPFFCWDNTGYALGRDNKDNPKRAAEMFAAFRDFHLSFRDELAGDEGFTALCRFLEQWDPARAEGLSDWKEAAGLNLVFRLRAQVGHVHRSEAVKSAWSRRLSAKGDDPIVTGVSLIDGAEGELARLHPQFSGVTGANTSGAALVSFNLKAFESYGKSQSYNAPVGTRDAFRYGTALNRLLADNARRTRIGDATVVFWSDRASGADAEEAFLELFGEAAPVSESAEDAPTVDRVRSFLEAARQGRLAECIRDPEAPFYVLGLSPNAARLNVRFWLTGNVAEFAKNLGDHVYQLEMVGARPDDPPIAIRRLIRETAREPKEIAPQLAGEVARAVLAGLPYPQALFTAVVRRIRVDGEMNHRRAAILKAYLIRNRRKEVPVALDKERPDESYQLGRLLAALERTQEDATDGKLNATIKDKFFGAAAATPASVFPRLLQLHQHHLNKLDNMGQRINRERLVGEICGRVQRFPSHLSLEHQGLFYIGYYHQRQDFFTKKTDSQETTDE